jgi:hypothetical protein
MSSEIYEKIGRRIVSIVTIAEFAKAADKGTGGKKNKCQPQNISCGKSCISGTKTCRISMTMEQQKAAKQLKAKLGVDTSKEIGITTPLKEGGGKLKLTIANYRRSRDANIATGIARY